MSDPTVRTINWNSDELIDAKQYDMKALVEAISRCDGNITTYQMAIDNQTEEKARLQVIVDKKEMLSSMGIETG
jgi:hypothetical protein